MRQNAKKTALSRRLLCALLCIAFLFGALMLSACDSSDADASVEDGSEAGTDAGKSEFTLDENGMVDVLSHSFLLEILNIF